MKILKPKPEPFQISQKEYLNHLWSVLLFYGVVFAVLLIYSCQPAHASSNEQIAQAIYKTENSIKYPYGIRSINTHGNKAYARKICLNSIKNARKRCVGSDLIVCMGERYSPPKHNPNWVRLVKYFLTRK